MRLVEVLFTDPRRAAQARAAVCATSIGERTCQVVVIQDVATYDHLASLQHSLAFPGSVLGAVGGGFRVGFVLAVASLVPTLDLDLTTVYLGSVAAFSYGALLGVLVGSHVLAPGPRAMRRGLARGRAIVRITVDDLASAMLAHDFLARQPGAERSFGD